MKRTGVHVLPIESDAPADRLKACRPLLLLLRIGYCVHDIANVAADRLADLQQYVAEEVPGVPICMANLFCIGTKNFYGVNLNAQAVDVDFTNCYVIE